jgi:hypothetical protein
MNSPINPGAFGSQPQPQFNHYPPVHLPAARRSRLRKVVAAFGAVMVPGLLLVASIAAYQALDEKKGSGTVVTEERVFNVDVQGIKLAGSPTVNVTVDPAVLDVKVEVTTDDNLLIDVKTEIKNNVLIIHPEGNISPTKGIRVDVRMKAMSSAHLTGSGNINVTGITGESFAASITGSGDVRLIGAAQSAEFSVTGSGDIQAEALDVARASARITGSGDITLKASESADLKVTGSGDITVLGQPPSLKRSVTGSGDIRLR